MSKTTRLSLWLFIVFATFTCQRKSESIERPQIIPVTNPWEDRMIGSFESYFESKLQSTKCPGAAVVIVKDSTIVFMKGFGVRDTRTSEPVDEHTVFRIGSLSKGFSGVLASKLIDQGHFNWDDKVVATVPEFTLQDKEQAERITIKNILSHTTGLGKHSYTNLIEDRVALHDIIPKFAPLKTYGKEGEFYAYQNAAFAMIEKVIEAETGDTYPESLESEIFQPIGMVDASATYEGMLTAENVALPHRYYRSKGTYLPLKINKKYYNAPSAGGINASISDMGEWLKMLLGNRPDVISDQALDSAFHPAVKIYERRSYRRWEGFKEAYYSMGWRVLRHDDRDILYHGGYVNDYVSQIALDRESKIGICVLYNAINSGANKVIPEFLTRYRDMEEKTNDELRFESVVGTGASNR